MAVTDDASTDTTESNHDGGRDEWTIAERVTFVVSAIIVCALMAVAIVEFLNQPAGATAVFEVTVDVDQADRQDDSFAIPFSVVNVGRAGARDVSVRFEVLAREDGAKVDEVTITIDILPVRGVEEGYLLITQDPATHAVTGRVDAFVLP
jgi:uncharacterized protein (TIGR02588 family)